MTTSLRVLIVEDSAEDAALILRELRRADFDPAHTLVDTKQDFLEAIESEPWDVVLSDFTIPRFSAMDALHYLRRSKLEIPFIVVTGTIDEETAVDCLKRGVDNYVLKENLTRLAPAVQQALRMFDDRRERRRLEEWLRHAQKMEAVGTLSAGVAHDLNNAITAILGYVETAKSNIPREHQAVAALNGIVKASKQAGGIAKSLLTFSRKTVSEKSPVDIGTIVRESVELLTPTLSAAIQVIPDIPQQQHLWVKGDPPQLQQMLVNLALNARDAMPDGGQLRIAVQHRAANTKAQAVGTDLISSDTGEVILTVADTGCGMPEEVQNRIFEPFYTTKTRSQGTGLGMSIVHGIVIDHGGRIELHSTEGQGTTVNITFPACAATPPGNAEPDADTIVQRRGETLLLAEDNQQVRGLIASALTAAGFQVIQTADGRAALDVFEKRDPEIDLLILDVDMPTISGLKCLRHIRKTDPEVPAILICGLPNPRTDEEFGNETLLRKPFRIPELTAIVHEMLTRQKQATTP